MTPVEERLVEARSGARHALSKASVRCLICDDDEADADPGSTGLSTHAQQNEDPARIRDAS